MQKNSMKIIQFQNLTKSDRKNLKRFVHFHWDHYVSDPEYVPLLDYEYLGFRLIGLKGFFESRNLFFKHAEMVWFLAEQDGKIVGRCAAFINHRHNQHWNDKTGFWGLFECIEEQHVADRLIDSSKQWLRERGMEVMRGPLNLPVNEATPGILTGGFDSRPVMYYHYNKPYYQTLLQNAGLKPVMRVFSWEVDPSLPLMEKFSRLAPKIIERYQITIEDWGQRSLMERKEEMLTIYNEAWSHNWGFVPFDREEFFQIVDDMMLIMNKKLFVFVYVRNEPAAFFGAVPNVTEKLKPIGHCNQFELIRALKMILTARSSKGIRLGYLGVRPKFHHLGLDGVMIWRQQKIVQEQGYVYCDAGWVLEHNFMITRMLEATRGKKSKTYTIFETKL